MGLAAEVLGQVVAQTKHIDIARLFVDRDADNWGDVIPIGMFVVTAELEANPSPGPSVVHMGNRVADLLRRHIADAYIATTHNPHECGFFGNHSIHKGTSVVVLYLDYNDRLFSQVLFKNVQKFAR